MELKEAKEILNKNGYVLNESGYTIFFTDDRDIVRLDGIEKDDFNEYMMNMLNTLQTELEGDARFKVKVGKVIKNSGSIEFEVANSSLPIVSYYYYGSDESKAVRLQLFKFEPQDIDVKVTRNGYDEKMLVLQKIVSAAPYTKTISSVYTIKKIIDNNIKIITSALLK